MTDGGEPEAGAVRRTVSASTPPPGARIARQAYALTR